MFKKLVLTSLALVTILSSVAQAEYVRGYARKNGAYVNGYNRSDSDGAI